MRRFFRYFYFWNYLYRFRIGRRHRLPRAVGIRITEAGLSKDETMGVLKVSKKRRLVVSETDEFGNTIPGSASDLQWTTSDPSLANVQVDDQGQPWVVPVGKLGTVRAQASAQVGGQSVVAQSADIILVPGDAAAITIGEDMNSDADNAVQAAAPAASAGAAATPAPAADPSAPAASPSA